MLQQIQTVSYVTAREKPVLLGVVDANALVKKVFRRTLHDLLKQSIVIHVGNVNPESGSLG
jgi:hypothetical protein